MLSQVPFQQFYFIYQVADKSLALKTANTTVIINNKIHPQIEPVPTNHWNADSITGFSNCGYMKKQLWFPSLNADGEKLRVFLLMLRRMDTDGKATKNFHRYTQWCGS